MTSSYSIIAIHHSESDAHFVLKQVPSGGRRPLPGSPFLRLPSLRLPVPLLKCGVESKAMHDTSLTLLNRLRQSPDSDSWNRFVGSYAPLVRAWLSRYDVQASDADDLSQEVLLAIFQSVAEFDHNGNAGAFRAWIKQILVNRLRNYWRRKTRDLSISAGTSIDERLGELDDPESALSLLWNQEHDQHVLAALLRSVERHFTPDTWNAFIRVALDGAKANVVVEELGISLNAVFVAKSRVLNRLRQEAEGLVESSSFFFRKH